MYFVNDLKGMSDREVEDFLNDSLKQGRKLVACYVTSAILEGQDCNCIQCYDIDYNNLTPAELIEFLHNKDNRDKLFNALSSTTFDNLSSKENLVIQELLKWFDDMPCQFAEVLVALLRKSNGVSDELTKEVLWDGTVEDLNPQKLSFYADKEFIQELKDKADLLDSYEKDKYLEFLDSYKNLTTPDYSYLISLIKKVNRLQEHPINEASDSATNSHEPKTRKVGFFGR